MINVEQLTQLNREARANGTTLNLIAIANEHNMGVREILELQSVAFAQINKEEQEKQNGEPELAQQPIQQTSEIAQPESALGQIQIDPYPNVPAELKQHTGWLTWKGGTDKQPFQSGTSIPASTSNPQHLVSYDTAVQNIQKGLGYPHLGFVPAHPIFGLDMDSCRDPETGELQGWAIELLKLLPETYTEVTPSQGGLRPWIKISNVDRKKTTFKIDAAETIPTKNPQVEVLAKNYGTITGQQYGNSSVIAEVTKEQWTKIAEYLRSLAPKTEAKTSSGSQFSTPEYVQKITAKDGDINAVLAVLPDVQEGGRDNFLASVLGKLHQAEWSDQNVLAAAERINQEKCHPPIGDPERIARSICRYEVKKPSQILLGGVPVGTAPHVQVKTEPQQDTINWQSQFRSVDEMEDGPIVMVINGVLQEGIAFIGANPGDGKTLVGLAFAKAISTGTPLFDMPQHDVPEPRTVIYLIPESRDRAFRIRCEAFQMPKEKMKFMARTISAGVPLELGNPYLLEAVRQTNPVVFLDTASRFMKGTDENAAAQNRLLVNDVIGLLAAGAVTVVLVHHATKEAKQKKAAMTLENMLRGSSDLGAMCDQAYGIRKDMVLYANGNGPMEIDLVNLKDREDVGTLTSIRLAASYKKQDSIFPVSYINEKHNFQVINDKEAFKRNVDSLVGMVVQDPNLPEKELAARTGMSAYTVKNYLNGRGWHRVQGGADGASPWHQDNGDICPFKKSKKGSAVVDLEKRSKPGIAEAVAYLKERSKDFPAVEEEILQGVDRQGLPDGLLRRARKRLGIKIESGMWLIPEPEVSATVN